MKINWIKSLNDFRMIDLLDKSQEKFIEGIMATNHSKRRLLVIFNHRNDLIRFLSELSQFSLQMNDFKIEFGILNDEELGQSHDAPTFEEPVVFFGNAFQQGKFASIFGDKAAFISNSCNGTNKTLAYQRHFSKCINNKSISLGEFKSDFTKTESVLRSSQALFFNLNAIRKQDSFYLDSKLTGLDIYEACQLLRYYGISSKQNLLFFSLNYNSLSVESWECLTTLFWYFLEGKNQTDIDHAEHSETDIYLVENSFFAEAITFIQAKHTKRWWFQHPESKEHIPCSENDYQNLREGILPDSLLDLYVS